MLTKQIPGFFDQDFLVNESMMVLIFGMEMDIPEKKPRWTIISLLVIVICTHVK